MTVSPAALQSLRLRLRACAVLGDYFLRLPGPDDDHASLVPVPEE